MSETKMIDIIGVNVSDIFKWLKFPVIVNKHYDDEKYKLVN